ncbi:MAG: hypothetical protein AAF488_07870 [Planctomycetota bacterium]
MQRSCCPICQCELARSEHGSTKFESTLVVLRCERCDYTTPCPEAEERADALLRLAERCRDATSDRIDQTVERLRSLRVSTRFGCPFCDGALDYRVAQEYLDCHDCGYQEHRPRAEVGLHLS